MQNHYHPAFQNRYRLVNGQPTIELKLKTPHQLFDERDPSPFRERDLDDEAAQYIVSSYRELPGIGGARLSLYFAKLSEFEGTPQMIRNAIHAYFHYESELKRRELRQIFRQGFFALGIGLLFLFMCIYFSHGGMRGSAQEPENFLSSVIHEGLFIMGWVAMWRPISIFLYEWWPIHEAQKTFMRLSNIEIEIATLEQSVSREADTGFGRKAMAAVQVPVFKALQEN
jgi:hypothetical protein